MKVNTLDGRVSNVTKSWYDRRRSSAYQRGCMGAPCKFVYEFEREAYDKGVDDSKRATQG